jgi:hypothetical protein
VQRALDFTCGSSVSTVAVQGLPARCSSESPFDVGNLHLLDPRAPLLSDSDVDISWMGDFEDFVDEDGDSGQKESDGVDTMEDPMAELGIYNPEEDLQGWSFKQLFDDNQWQDQHLTLLGGPRHFTRPPLRGMLGSLPTANNTSEDYDRTT